MYSSLDRVDIVATDPSTGGEKLVQTDHRQASEIADEPELSVLFGLTRVINAQRVADARKASSSAVHYVCFDRPPPFFCEAISSAGAAIVVGGDLLPYDGARIDPSDLADRAFRELAERVQRTHDSGAAGEQLLAALERDLDEHGTPDEIAYWTRIVELAAVGGELLRARTGGRWIRDPGNYADVPFVFQTPAGAIINAANKAKKRVDIGASESMAQLLRIVDDEGSAGRPMLTLKPSDWEARSEAVARPLLKGFSESPIVAFGTDLPNTFAILTTQSGETHDIEELAARALETLRTIDVTIEEMTIGDSLRLFVVSGDYFACEKLLDRDFMRQMEQRIGVPLLAAGIPVKGLLLLTSAVVEPETMGGFMAICEGRHRDAAPRERVSPAVFLVQEGAVCGVVRPATS